MTRALVVLIVVGAVMLAEVKHPAEEPHTHHEEAQGLEITNQRTEYYISASRLDVNQLGQWMKTLPKAGDGPIFELV